MLFIFKDEIIELLNGLHFNYINSGFATPDQQWQRSNHLFSWNRLFFIHSGEAEFELDGCTYPLQKGKCYLFPAGRQTAYRCSSQFSLDWLHFEASAYLQPKLLDVLQCPVQLTSTGSPLGSSLNSSLTSPLSNALFKLLHQLGRQEQSFKVNFEQSAIIQLLLAPFITQGVPKKQLKNLQRLQPVLTYIENNLGSQLRLPELAQQVYLEVNYFSRLFLKVIGVSPGLYIQQCRMEVACRWLLGSDKSIEVIAQELGYFDASHFCRLFKQTIGQTPKQYKQHNINPI